MNTIPTPTVPTGARKQVWDTEVMRLAQVNLYDIFQLVTANDITPEALGSPRTSLRNDGMKVFPPHYWTGLVVALSIEIRRETDIMAPLKTGFGDTAPLARACASLMLSKWREDESVSMVEVLAAYFALSDRSLNQTITVGEIAYVLSISRRDFFASFISSIYSNGLADGRLFLSANDPVFEKAYWKSHKSDAVLVRMRQLCDRGEGTSLPFALLWTWLCVYIYEGVVDPNDQYPYSTIQSAVRPLMQIPILHAIPYLRVGIFDADIIREAARNDVDPQLVRELV